MIELRTSTNNVKYGVRYACGTYDTKIEGILCICDTKEQAETIKEKLVSHRNRIIEIAVKDVDMDYSYTTLHDDFIEGFFVKLGKDGRSDELTHEEWDQFDEYQTDENFKKYLVSKGYSEEVADATIIYNSYDDWSEVQTHYNVVDIPYLGPDETFEIKGENDVWVKVQ